MALKEHECLTNARNKWKEDDESIVSVYFDCANVVSMTGDPVINKTGQRLWVIRNHTKKDGTLIKKTEKTFVGHVFCPWCGEKYSELKK